MVVFNKVIYYITYNLYSVHVVLFSVINITLNNTIQCVCCVVCIIHVIL